MALGRYGRGGMIELYVAPAGRGKSGYLIEEVRALCAKQGIAQALICVPTALQAAAWRERLAAGGGGLGAQVVTLDRLVGMILDMAGAEYTEISPPVQFRLLRTICQEEKRLVHYAPLIEKGGFIEVLQQRLGDFKASKITPEALLTAWAGAEPRLRELAFIYERYQARLQAESWADRVGLQWLALETLAERTALGRSWPLLMIDGFDDFTDVHLALWQTLSQRVGRFVLTLTQGEKVTFARYQRTLRLVKESLGVEERPLPTLQSGAQPALHYLNQNLFTTAKRYEGGGKERIQLIEAPERAMEVRAALRWLKQKMVLEGMSIREVALVAREIGDYRPFIQQIAAEMGIPVRFLDGLPLNQSPVIASLMNLLRLHLPLPGREGEVDEAGHNGRLPRREVVTAWRSPYFKWQSNGEELIKGQDGVRLDWVARQQQVVRGYEQWQEALAVCLAAEERGEEVEVDIEDGPLLDLPTGAAAERLQAQFNFFYQRSRPPVYATLRQYVAWLERLIGPDPDTLRPDDDLVEDDSLQIVSCVREVAESADEDLAALRLLKDILRGMIWAAATMTRTAPMRYQAFFDELQAAVNSAQYMMPLQAYQPEMVVGNVTQLRGVVLRAVAVLGLSEGAFPITIREDPFLRDADRVQLGAALGKDLVPSTNSSEREFFYEAVTRPTSALLLTRPTLADNGAEWVASPFWEEMIKLLGVEVVERLGSGAYARLAEAASWAEWWERAAVLGMDGNPLAKESDAEGWFRLQKAQKIWGARLGGGLNKWQGDLTETADWLRETYGPQHIWSASRFESYQRCGYFFWVQNVLKLEPKPEPMEGLTPTQIGSVYHDIFEEVYGEGRPALAGEVGEAWVRGAAEKVLAEAPQKHNFRVTAWWEQTCEEILETVWESVQVLEQDSFRFYRAEAAFGTRGNRETVLVLGEGDEQLLLSGYIDRVDRDERGRIRIVDYKLGGKASFTAKAFAEGKKLQLPLYAAAAMEALGLGEVVDGFYWHFRKGEPSDFQLGKVEGGVGEAIKTAEGFARQVRAGIQSGYFPATPPAGGCPSYCPAISFCWQYEKGWWD
ncbi:MAG TPA: PD-(D/E)XK nuclease family protein [Anaerolineae bacterium]|nr:PD-(D/E)XK nuclease family protein [Anaerolineae bacterium]